MKSIVVSLVRVCVLLLFSSMYVYSQSPTLQDSLLVYFPIADKVVDASGNKVKFEVHSAKKSADRHGKQKSALEFYSQKGMYNRGLWIHKNFHADAYPIITITAWVKLGSTSGSQTLVSSSNSNKTRGFGTTYSNGYTHWCAYTGDSDVLLGDKVTNEWAFIAVMYNQKAQEVRFVVNNKVYKSKAYTKKGYETLTVGNFEGFVDEVRIYSRFLTVAELADLYGAAIDARDEDFQVKERVNVSKKQKEQELSRLDSMPVRVVYNKEISVYDSVEGKNVQFYLQNNDTIQILSRDAKHAIIVAQGKKGIVRCSTLTEYTYGIGESRFVIWVKTNLSGLFAFTTLAAWIRMIIFALILFFGLKYFARIDSFFARFSNYDEFKASANKHASYIQEPVKPLLRRVFPCKRFQRWPLFIGVLSGALLFVFSLWNSVEFEWFINEGFALIPSHSYYTFDWIMWGSFMFILLLLFLMIVESFVVGGVVGGLLRIVFILVFNVLALVVTFFIFVLVAIVLLAILALSIFAASGSTRYRCTNCGTVFRGSNCPYCG